MADKVEDIFKKVSIHKGVEGILICNKEGIPIKSTITDEDRVYLYTTGVVKFITKCKDKIKSLILEDINLFRIRSKALEILIAPQGDLILIVIQKPLANN